LFVTTSSQGVSRGRQETAARRHHARGHVERGRRSAPGCGRV